MSLILPTLLFFAMLVSLPFYINVGIVLSTAIKFCWDSDRKYTNMYINLERIDILTVLSLPVHEHCMSIYLDLLYFLSSEFCSFQCTSPGHNLLDLYPIIIFFKGW